MNLSRILPRPLAPGAGSADCASLLLSLIMAAHLDRALSRSLGWRGVRPSGETAFTCRVLGSDCVFGVAFSHEEATAHNTLRGQFALYVFPPAASRLLDKFPLAALQLAMGGDYDRLVRNFSPGQALLEPFHLGGLTLVAPLDGNGIAFRLAACARLRVISLNGVWEPGSQGWIIAPGSPDCDIPAFRLLLPFFSTLAATAEAVFSEVPAAHLTARPVPAQAVAANGAIVDLPGASLREIVLSAAYGASVPGDKAARPLPHLPRLPARQARARKQLPVIHVLTGFLGSGKTTFLKEWLDFLHGRERYTGVIQNEFGPVDLDSALLAADTVVEALDDGCVCCSLADSLRPGIERMLAKLPAHQFILETTGVANPANVADALVQLSDLVSPGLVICVVDALSLEQGGVAAAGIAREQIKGANVIVINKMDLVAGAEEAVFTRLADMLRPINPGALILPARGGKIPFASLDALLDEARPGSGLLFQEHRRTHQEEGFASRAVRFDRPVALTELENLINIQGPALVRLKGVIAIDNYGPCVVQYVPGNLEITPQPELTPEGLSLIVRAVPAGHQHLITENQP